MEEIIMDIEFEETLNPKPNEELIKKKEGYWRLKLPTLYYQFLLKYNGGIPVKRNFYYKNHRYYIVSFLGILKDYKYNEYGDLDIDVVLTQLDERLTDNEDLIGCELLPIAELTGYDYVCLDFRKNPDSPFVCVWSFRDSGEFDPVTVKIADSFEEFIEMLE